MNKTRSDEYLRLVKEGRRRADHTGNAVLVSFVTEIASADPIAFYAYEASKFIGSRFFWTEPEGGMTIAGLGRVITIEPANAELRFQEIEQEWRQIAGSAVVSDSAPACAGPFFFGGFSFDAKQTPTELWKQFPHTRFVVPELMLTLQDGHTWITVNRMISPHQDIGDGVYLDPLPGTFADTMSKTHARMNMMKEEIDPSGWMNSVEEAARLVRGGTLGKIVLARELRLYADQPFEVENVLERLYRMNTNTFVFALEQGDDCLIGATPERLIRSCDGRFLTMCLAGSIARGGSDEEDAELEEALSHDEKNLHEHAITVRMISDIMRRLCDTIEMPEEPILYKLRDIQHLFTPVIGQAKEGVSILRALEQLHPTPALGGWPQKKAVEAIRALETLDRGWYAAPIGWVNRTMDGEFAAAIRSALLQGKEASLFAGCGIMGDSDPHSEYQESALKFRPMLTALEAAGDDA